MGDGFTSSAAMNGAAKTVTGICVGGALPSGVPVAQLAKANKKAVAIPNTCANGLGWIGPGGTFPGGVFFVKGKSYIQVWVGWGRAIATEQF